MKKLFVCGLVSFASMGIATTASAQDASASATYGDVSLNAGLVPDPTVVDVTSGGGIQASDRLCRLRGERTGRRAYLHGGLVPAQHLRHLGLGLDARDQRARRLVVLQR